MAHRIFLSGFMWAEFILAFSYFLALTAIVCFCILIEVFFTCFHIDFLRLFLSRLFVVGALWGLESHRAPPAKLACVCLSELAENKNKLNSM